MTAAEHYRAAERLLAEANRHNTEHPSDMRVAEVTAYCAQVHATLALVDVHAQADVVEAVVYCGHDGCGLPDGHLSAHAAGPRAGRTWTDDAGDSLTVDDVQDDDTVIAVWLLDKDGHNPEMVRLTSAQAREFAADLRARASHLDGGAR